MKNPSILKLLIICILISGLNLSAQEIEHSPQNSKCFACHGSKTYTYYNDILERHVTKRMNPYFIIDSVLYYDQNHKTFECIDCHSYDYRTFPHDASLRMEPMPNCIDCHGGDEDYAKFNFEAIEEEFQQSVHSTKHSEEFTCYMCHNPHNYKISARTEENIKDVIVYDNNICLSCHANVDKYQLITDMAKPNVLQKHDWLPNQLLHFSSVRCIECHTKISDSTLVAHLVQPKEKAVKLCVECHSSNSRLMATLYKFQATEARSKFGFFNASVLNNTYIIGANRNLYLDIASILIVGFVILGIIIHAFLRYKFR
ncbi:MAG: cytochrome c3 family protein [bacterium]|jgi:hypothetical protein